ncbi:MAG: hypothetical protein MJ071_09130, partial [Oscillospiraceae bacterium]|nr:hypothetical protein [Oscillospiraceae bacterium]
MKRVLSALSSLCLAATSVAGSLPILNASAASVKADAPATTVVYDLVPHGKDYTAIGSGDTGNNKYTAAAGESLTIDWTVKHDQGTAGLQIYFDFSQVNYTGGVEGDAYMCSPEYNDKDANTASGEKAGLVSYVFGQATEEDPAEDGSVIYSFNVKVPQDNGVYTIGLKSGQGMKTKVVPRNQDNPYTVIFHGLDITVGEGGSKTTTTTPATGSKDAIIYNLIPSGKNYKAAADSASGNNVYTAEAGEKLTVDWTVKNDQGTAGLQIYFDFSQVEYAGGTEGDAYMCSPQYNDTNAKVTSGDKAGLVSYVFGQANEEEPAKDGDVIYSFNVKVPSDAGTYTIGLKKGENMDLKVVPKDQENPYSVIFHGLSIVVEDTTPVSGDTIIYDLVPAGKEYTAVAANAKGNNVYNATAGEELRVNWTVKNDQGTAGLQIFFDFSQVEYVGSADDGDAYMCSPEINEKNANATTGTNAGLVSYVFGQATEEDIPDDGAVIYCFDIKVPKEDGTYTIGLMNGQGMKTKVVPKNQDQPHSTLFHGLDIVVGDATPGTTTTKAQTTTTTTKGGTVDPTGKIIYNLVPAGKEYTAAADGSSDNNVYNATAGEALRVNWTVKQDQGTAGLQIFFDFSQVEYVGSADDGDAYMCSPEINEKNANATTGTNAGLVSYVFGQATEEDIPDDGAVIYCFDIKVPKEDGTYTIGLMNGQGMKTKVVPKNQDQPHEVIFHGLDIVVGAAVTTTTPKTTTTTAKTTTTIATTTSPVGQQAGKSNWTIGTVTVAGGAAAKVPVSVTGDEGTAGFVVRFAYDESLKLDEENPVTWADGYTGEAVINGKDLVVVWSNGDGGDQKADGTILYLNFVAPEKEGEYPVTFAMLEVTNTDGDELDVTKEEGKVIVKGVAGKSNWVIGEKTVAPSAKAQVPVTVTGDEGTAGFVVKFAYDEALTLDAENPITWADGYTGEATINNDKLIVVWASDEGANQKADGTILSLNFVAPAKEGKYPVTFDMLEVTDTNGTDVAATKKDGAVIVEGTAGKSNWVIGEKTVAPSAK